MKLKEFKNLGHYHFILQFENGEMKDADLKNLISDKVKENELKTAHIDKDWGCLEFNDGMIDIEPNTLYKFCMS